MSRQPMLCIAGGGTGGHVMPALALADAARNKWPELKVQFIGAERGLEARLLPERGESVLLLAMHGVKGAGLLQKIRVLAWELPRSVLNIRRSWKNMRPDLLVGVGGYASVSGVLAALTARVPVVLYEQNAMPGIVNRYLARFCSQIMLGFAAAASKLSSRAHMAITGNIVRDSIAMIRWTHHQPPCLLVMGGSQGARVLNENVPDACSLLVQKGRSFTIIHIAGNDAEARSSVINTYAKAGIKAEVLPFCDDMSAFYAAGDLLIARSGAMTVSEAAMCGMPAIFVPLPHAADDHQRYNALAQQNGARVMDQKHISASSLALEIEDLLFNEKRLAAMSRDALQQAPKDAVYKQLDVLSGYLAKAGSKP
ncbi:MAG TPA: undecaprenyldiphospho-muramoylpentapeptide beta-N-acetylglucosaminyltransferase [Mariprofundaceae bacterium]|nr:undecaprenyldiphospho-muramoylpentapeptide beta-N-acetylglucosaminyltransferase [Mariprofundaceae bacterium]